MTIDLMTPTYAANMRLIGHADQDGRGDGQQIMVHNGHGSLRAAPRAERLEDPGLCHAAV